MNYPTWLVEGIGAGWVIGIIASLHVLVSHFAVGGGILLPVTEYWARKGNRTEILDFLKDYSRLFLILTNVLGAITGVGIWFSIGLVSPDATSLLIRLFAFLWAAEWVVFLVEIAALVFYYYGWERMKPQTHQIVGWIYAITAFLSLFVINGILTFKLTPGSWEATRPFETIWQGYFNPGFWPSLLLRTLLCLALAGIYATFTISRLPKEHKLRQELLSYVSLWALPIFTLIGVCLFWYFGVTDETVKANLLSGLSGGVGNAAFGNMAFVARIVLLCIVVIVTVGLALFFSAFLNPKEFSVGKSALLLAMVAIFIVSFEYSREMLRKPYIVRGYMFSNGILKAEASAETPQDAEKLQRSFIAEMKFKPEAASTGQKMFVGQCMACHTVNGYRSLSKRLAGRDSESIYQLLSTMQKPGEENPYHDLMPPLIGTEEEVRALSDYLAKAIQESQQGATTAHTHSSNPETIENQ